MPNPPDGFDVANTINHGSIPHLVLVSRVSSQALHLSIYKTSQAISHNLGHDSIILGFK
jgi:hypothetical protein